MIAMIVAVVLLTAAVVGVPSFIIGFREGMRVGRREAQRIADAAEEPAPALDSTSIVVRRGACGIAGCPNTRPHSHVHDLARRLEEMRKKQRDESV